mgnify:FL=1
MSYHYQPESLEKRMNQYQLDKRKERIRARSTVAAQLTGQINLAHARTATFFMMGPWGRLRWLLLGGRYSNQQGTYMLLGLLGLLMLLGIGSLSTLL